MRNELNMALMHRLHACCDQYANDNEELTRLYALYSDHAEDTLSALRGFTALLFDHAVNEDGHHKNLQKISPATLLHTSIILRNNLDMLDFALYGKEKIGDKMYALAIEGGNNG